jgi:two-component system sensor histidine kinase PhoQ
MFGDDLLVPGELAEPRFNQLESGLYARIHDGETIVWRSPSALVTSLSPLTPGSIISGQEQFLAAKAGGNDAYLLTFDVSWDTESGVEQHYRFEVFQDQGALKSARNNYRKKLWRSLGSMTIALLLIQWTIHKWGLRPMSNLATELRKLQRGENLAMSETYPAEIKPVVVSLNRVLAAERDQRDRYRNTMADLAHSLKTPLAVIRSNLADPDADRTVIEDQVLRMDDIIRHQLQRAVGGSSSISRQLINIGVAVERIIDALQKVYAEKKITVVNELPDAMLFAGDESDLLEMLGNLLDNAFKYTNNAIQLTGEITSELVIYIDDNGQGVPTAMRGQILRRGARADTAQTGQGIGLAVVTDIVSTYGGALSVGESSLGGARFTIALPRD